MVQERGYREMEQMYRGRRGRWKEADSRTGRDTDKAERVVVDCVRACVRSCAGALRELVDPSKKYRVKSTSQYNGGMYEAVSTQ